MKINQFANSQKCPINRLIPGNSRVFLSHANKFSTSVKYSDHLLTKTIKMTTVLSLKCHWRWKMKHGHCSLVTTTTEIARTSTELTVVSNDAQFSE